jgi:hypothetical protein
MYGNSYAARLKVERKAKEIIRNIADFKWENDERKPGSVRILLPHQTKEERQVVRKLLEIIGALGHSEVTNRVEPLGWMGKVPEEEASGIFLEKSYMLNAPIDYGLNYAQIIPTDSGEKCRISIESGALQRLQARIARSTQL